MSLTHPAAPARAGHHADLRTDLVEQLDQHVRELVRREGVDPQRDAAVVRRIAESVVRDHDQRSLTGQVASVPDPDSVVGELVARVSGFGPLQPFLEDAAVEEIWINDPSRVFIARNGRHELTNLVLTTAQVQELVERMLKSSGRRIDVSSPFVDAMLPEGHRLHVVLEGISRGFSAVNIRKFVLKAARLHHLVELGSLSPRAAAFLEASVRAGLNILVAGGTQAGKTTMLNCLAAAIPGGERVISAEEVFELRFPHPDCGEARAGLAGDELLHILRGTKQPIATYSPCYCESGRPMVECCEVARQVPADIIEWALLRLQARAERAVPAPAQGPRDRPADAHPHGSRRRWS